MTGQGGHVSRPRRSRSAKKGSAEPAGSVGALQAPTASGAKDDASGAMDVEAPTVDDYREARRKAEGLEAVGDEVVRRLEAAIASITAVLRRR